jgi:glycosyltransferase involved in cell wall biosynthesis
MSYRKAMAVASYSFYLNELIKKDNDDAFGVPGTVIYNTSSIKSEPIQFEPRKHHPVISYFGNLGYNRSKVLVEVAEVIKEINCDAVFDVYGKGYIDAMKRLEDCKNMNYHGFIPYKEILSVIRQSDIVLHVESQDSEVVESIKYGFTTKIADCLSSGKPFLLYSSRDIACAQYLIGNDCAWFADTRESLKEAILSILHDNEMRDKKLARARKVAETNHSSATNCEIFQERLKAIIE